MNYSTGKLGFIFLAALVLAWAGAWLLARRYRVTMTALMRAASVAPPAAAAAPSRVASPAAPDVPPVRRVSLAQNRRAGWRLTAMLLGVSVLMAASSAWLTLWLDAGHEPVSIKRAAVLALANTWPAIPAIGLLWRWSLRRMLALLLGWGVLCFAVLLWRSIEVRPMESLLFLALQVGPPLGLIALLCLGATSRAAAPWLLVPLLGLVWASIAGIDVLAVLVAQRSPWLTRLPAWAIPHGVMAAFALLPWLVAWWPLRWLGRALGRAYGRQWLSEGLVLFTAVWAVTLLVQALSAASRAGLMGAVMLLPLLWVPLAMALAMALSMALAMAMTALRVQPAATGRPPTLLVLRVFQHDAQVQALFDHVVERWRLSGNTVLIAGTDLIDRTLDAADIFTFLDGGLAQRFIHTAADVPQRLAAFDLAPDVEGRFRVNECYCHDSTWQQALAALLERSSVVLMDLRGFQAHNAGCRFELAALAAATRLARVVVLVDAQTDRACAEADAAGAPAGRFVWVDAGAMGAATRREALRCLFTE